MPDLFFINPLTLIIMPVLKVVELMSDSSKSFEDAIETAVRKAGKTLQNVRSAYVKEQSVTVNGDAIQSYRVILKVSFEVKD